MKNNALKKLFFKLRKLIDIILSFLVIFYIPITFIFRKISLNQLPLTQKQLARAGIDLVWLAEDNLTENSISGLKSVAIAFQGGLGAQIISAAIYFYLHKRGYKVYADFSYFNHQLHIASIGDGRCSQWRYHLDEYGLPMEYFENVSKCKDSNLVTVVDGPLKVRLFKKAISDPDIKKYFPISKSHQTSNLPEFYGSQSVGANLFLCMHMRRGDYMNSSVHRVIAEDSFLSMAKKFNKQYTSIVITSDSKLSDKFKSEISKLFTTNFFLDDILVDELKIHDVMRQAAILVCSNSQFSMTAGALSDGLVFIPTKFFNGNHQNDLSKVIFEEYSEFSLLNL